MSYDSTKDTQKHIDRVVDLTTKFITLLMKQAVLHDKSKLESPEKEAFDAITPELAKHKYGSDGYNKAKDSAKDAIKHHIENNRHHPGFHKNGIDDMDLADIIEMLIDWKAASERSKDGNISESIKTEVQKNNISGQLEKILLNTSRRMEWT